MRARIPFLLVAFLGLGLLSCAKNPVTGKRELSFISEDQEIAMGQEGKAQMEAAMGVYDDPELSAYVSDLGMKVAKNSERPDLPWSFTVADDPIVNAFALPGGPVFVSRGILAHMNSEAELMSVLGHEVTHITAKHSVSRMSEQTVANLGLGVGTILAGDYGGVVQQVGGTGLQMLFLSYSRGDESQSDQHGFRYMMELGYDVREMPEMFRILQRVSGGSTLPEWQSSHPDPGNRIEAAQERIAELPPGALEGTIVGQDRFLDHIDGITFGTDPRQGYTDDGQFIHPDLRWRFDVPADWAVQNSPQAVYVFPESQEAYLQLTLAGSDGATAAANGFFGQEGITAGAPQETTINGLPAVVGDFQAQGQNGPIAGRAGFIDHGGNTYGLLGLTSPEKIGEYRPVFDRLIRSFAPETRGDKLNVEPMRLRVVRLDSAMSLRKFAETYPSDIPFEKLAIINGVADPDAAIPAGNRVKRVTR